MPGEKAEPNTFNFWRNFAVDVCTGVALLWFGASRHGGTFAEIAGLLLAGLLLWSLLEYWVHRLVLHGPWLATRKDHALHHARPTMTPLTPWYAHLLAGLAFTALIAAFSSLAVASLIGAGVYAGYNWFRVVHRILHFHFETAGRRLLGTRFVLHEQHHERPYRHYGVTTSIWDRVFGTFEAPSRDS